MDDDFRKEFKKLHKRLDVLDDIKPVVYGLEEKVETILESVNELGRIDRLEQRFEKLPEKLGVEV